MTPGPVTSKVTSGVARTVIATSPESSVSPDQSVYPTTYRPESREAFVSTAIVPVTS
jgi:hypothetical protein